MNAMNMNTVNMNTVRAVCENCSHGSEAGRLTFPQVLGELAAHGIEGYWVDLRRNNTIYHLPGGETVEVMKPPRATPVAAAFDAAAIAAIIRRVQQGALRYPEFCAEVMRAGCAGYLVSLPGRRAVYFGRTGETHVEHFPAAT